MATPQAIEREGEGFHRSSADARTRDRTSELPESLATLLSRCDAGAMDLPGGKRARIRLVVEDAGQWDVLVRDGRARLAASEGNPDAILAGDTATWERIAADMRGGMDAFRTGRLIIRHNLHVGVGFLAATSGSTDLDRLRFQTIDTASGPLSILSAGFGDPVVLVHGLGATKGSFLPTVAALASSFRVIALDLPGFGDSVKPLTGAYDPPFFAKAVVDMLDALGLPHAHIVGNSLGGRIALELGLRHPQRVDRLVLLAPSLAWKRERPWAPLVRALRPELGLIQLTPRWAVEAVVHRILPVAGNSWVRAGADEFLRAYLTPRGRVAFYAAARQIYLEEPHGADGFWTRLAALERPSLFVWGRFDWLVPLAFAAHVRHALPSAHHLEVDCGHVPQVERPAETHAAMAVFLRGVPSEDATRQRRRPGE